MKVYRICSQHYSTVHNGPWRAAIPTSPALRIRFGRLTRGVSRAYCHPYGMIHHRSASQHICRDERAAPPRNLLLLLLCTLFWAKLATTSQGTSGLPPLSCASPLLGSRLNAARRRRPTYRPSVRPKDDTRPHHNTTPPQHDNTATSHLRDDATLHYSSTSTRGTIQE